MLRKGTYLTEPRWSNEKKKKKKSKAYRQEFNRDEQEVRSLSNKHSTIESPTSQLVVQKLMSHFRS